jgi:chemotaxis-related protein WspD
MHTEQRMERCWKQIGVYGDASCSLLPKYTHCRHCEQYAKVAKSLFDRIVPGDDLLETTAQLAGGKETLQVAKVSLLIFRVLTEWLALPTQFLEGVLDPRPVHVVPFRSNGVFTGLVNVNGELLPCFSVADLLQLSAEPAGKRPQDSCRRQRMVVFGKDRKRYVFPVDEILGVRKLPLDGMTRPPSTLDRSHETFTRGVVQLDSKAIGWLDEQKLHSGLEGSLAP